MSFIPFLKRKLSQSLPPNFDELVQYLTGKIEKVEGVWKLIDEIAPEYSPDIIASNVLTSDGSAVLTFSDLTDVTIVSQVGTGAAVIVGDTVTIAAGYLADLVLSDGTHLKLSAGAGTTAYDVSTNVNHATISGGGTWSTADVRPDNALDGFSSTTDGTTITRIPYDATGNPITP